MKKTIALIIALALCFGIAACTAAPATEKPAEEPAVTAPAETDKPADEPEVKAPETEPKTESEPEPAAEPVTMRVGSLKGPTSMGLVNLMKKAETEGAVDNVSYEFTMTTQADEIAAGIISGDLDAAVIPANLASVLFNKTEGKISVVDINTLGVLYCVTGDESIKSVSDLAGRKIVLTGQGNTPEFSLRYLLDEYGVEGAELDFKSEATEVAAALAADPTAVGVLPQPFATVAQVQNDALHEAFSLSDEWDALGKGSGLVTGVTVVRKEFIEANGEAVRSFLKDHAESAEKAVSDVEGTANLVAEYGIIEKAPVAKKALPKCAISAISGSEMREKVEGYLTVLYGFEPKSVGGFLPDDSFYYEG